MKVTYNRDYENYSLVKGKKEQETKETTANKTSTAAGKAAEKAAGTVQAKIATAAAQKTEATKKPVSNYFKTNDMNLKYDEAVRAAYKAGDKDPLYSAFKLVSQYEDNVKESFSLGYNDPLQAAENVYNRQMTAWNNTEKAKSMTPDEIRSMAYNADNNKALYAQKYLSNMGNGEGTDWGKVYDAGESAHADYTRIKRLPEIVMNAWNMTGQENTKEDEDWLWGFYDNKDNAKFLDGIMNLNAEEAREKLEQYGNELAGNYDPSFQGVRDLTEDEKWWEDYYRHNTLEGAREWAETDGTDEATSNLWQVENGLKYGALEQNPDFEEKSGYKAPEETKNIWGIDKEGGEKRKYRYIAGTQKDREEIDEMFEHTGTGVNLYAQYKYMNDEERKKYRYIYNTEGKDAAEDFLKFLSYDLDTRMMNGYTEYAYNLSEGGALDKVGASVVSLPMQFLSGLGAVDIGVQKVGKWLTGDNSPVNYNTPWQSFGKGSQALRAGVTDRVNWNVNLFGKDIDLFDMPYETVMSTLDSLLAGATGQGGVIIGLSAASSSMQQLHDKGISDEMALIGGIISGVAEGLFETVSIGKFYENANKAGKGIKSKILDTLAQMGINGSEEFNTEIANILSDYFLNGEKSDAYQLYQHYKDMGLSDGEATKKAILDLGGQALEAGLGGTLQGLLMGGTANAVSAARESASNKRAGKTVLTNGTAQKIKDIGMTFGPDTKAGKIAKLYKPGKASAKETGKLYRAILAETGSKELNDTMRGIIRQDVEAALMENGGNEQDWTTVSGIMTLFEGGQMTHEEFEAVARSKAAMDLVEQLNGMEGENLESGKETQESRAADEDNDLEAMPGEEDLEPMPEEGTEKGNGLKEIGDSLGLAAAKEYEKGKATIEETGKLFRSILNSAVEQGKKNAAREAAQSAVEQELTKKGGDAKNILITGGLTSMMAGQQLTNEQKTAIVKNDAAMEVAREIAGEGESREAEAPIQPATEAQADAEQEESAEQPEEQKEEKKAVPVGKGQVTFTEEGSGVIRDGGGNETDLSDADLSEGEKRVILDSKGMDGETAGEMVKAYEEEEEETDGETFARGFKRIVEEAKKGLKSIEEIKSLYGKGLSEKAKNAAIAAATNEKARQQEADKKANAAAAKAAKVKTMDEAKGNEAGAFFANVKNKLRNDTALQIRLIDAYAKKAGLQVRVYDSLGNANASYQKGSNVIHLSLDAEGNALTRTMSHEIYHYIKEWNEGGAEDIQRLVENALSQKEGYDLEARIKEKQDKYKKNGVELRREDALEEIAADSMLDFIGTEENIHALAAQDGKILPKIKEWIDKAVERLQSILRGVSDYNAETKALMSDLEYLKNRQAMIENAVNMAKDSYAIAQRNGGNVKNDSAAKAFVEEMRSATDAEGRREALSGLISQAFARTQGNYLQSNPDADWNQAMNKFAGAVSRFAGENIAMDKALRDAGFDAPKAGTPDMALLSYASRKMAELKDVLAIDEYGNIKKESPRGSKAIQQKSAGGDSNGILIESNDNVKQKFSLKEEEKKENFKKWFGDSKVVDEDGKPLVVYHGTDADFTAFDMSKGRANMDIQGAFFSPYQEDAEGYGGKVGAYYLRIENPASESVAYKALNMFKGQNEAGKKARDYLISKGYDGVNNGGEEYIAFYSWQIKSATDNIGTFDRGNPDFRYSFKEDGTGSDIVELIQDDAELYAQAKTDRDMEAALQMVQQLHEAAMNTTGTGAWDKRVYEIADKLLQETGSEYGRRKLAQEIRNLYQAMDEKGTDVGEMLMYARDIGRHLIENIEGAAKTDETVAEALRIMKDSRFYLTDDMKSEMRETLGSVSAFTRKNMGEMGIRAQATGNRAGARTSLSEVFQELSQLMPGSFPAETAEVDMPFIMEAFIENAGKQDAFGAYGSNGQQYATDLGISMMLDFYDVPGALREAKEIRDAARSQVEKIRAGYQQKYQDKITRQRDNKAQTEEKRKIRGEIQRNVKYMNSRIMNESDQRHVPENLKGAVIRMMDAFIKDTSVFDEATLQKLRQAYADLKETGENADTEAARAFDEEILQMIETMEKTMAGRRLSELTRTELDMVNDVVGNLKKMCVDANEMFLNGRKTTTEKAGKDFLRELQSKDPVKAQKLMAFLNNNTTPIYFAKNIGGVFKQAFDDIMEGQNKWAFWMTGAKEWQDRLIDKYEVNDWINDGERLRFKTVRGDEIELTREQALSLYATWQRETKNKVQNANHLSMGGFMYAPGTKIKGVETSKPHAMGELDINTIKNWLGEKALKYADEMVYYLSNDMANIGNDMSMKLYGYRKFTEKYYFPYSSSKDFIQSDVTKEVELDGSLKRWGAAKKLQTKANNPVIIRNFTDTWTKHVNEMCIYGAFTEAVDNLNRIFNYKTDVLEDESPDSIKAQLKRVYGDSAEQYIRTMVRDIAGGVRAADRSNLGNKLISAYKKNAVIASASVAVQQPSAIMRAMALMNPKYFVGKPKNPMKSWNELLQYSGVAIVKEMGRFDTGTGLSATEWLSSGIRKDKWYENAKNTAENITGFAPEKMDQITWGIIWEAVKREQAENNVDITTEEGLKQAAQRFNEVINYTQVYDSVLSRSQIMRSNSQFDKMVTSFMAEPTVSFNLLKDAIMHFRDGNYEGKVTVKRAVAAFTASALLNAMLKSLVTAGRKKDEEKTYAEKYAEKLTENFFDDWNPLGLIPMVKDVLSIFQGYDVERADMSVIQDLKDAIDALDNENLSLYEKIERAGGAVAGLFGVPVRNIMRDFRTAYNVFLGSKPIGETSGTAIKYGVLEGTQPLGITVYSGKNADYYSRMVDAMLRGDEKKMDEMEWYMTERKGVKDKSVTSGMKTEVKERMLDGKITEEETIKILKEKFGLKEQDAYFKVDEWKTKKEHEDDEDYSYSRYGDLFDAMQAGKPITEQKKELTSHGYKEKDIIGQIKSQIGKWYKDGEMDKKTATDRLKKYANITDTNDIFWLFDEWDNAGKKGSDEEYRKYGDYFKAVETGKNLATETKKLMNHGVKAETIASQITQQYKEQYIKLSKTNKVQATNLKARLLTAYEALGYNRNKKQRDIENWLKEDTKSKEKKK